MTPALLKRVAADHRGASIAEFGFVAPILGLVLIGGLDIGHSLYMTAVLQGVLQKSARDAALEGGGVAAQQAAIDARVREQVLLLHRKATVTFTRRFYRTFAEMAAAAHEDWTDGNGNGRCDAGERYTDANNNNVWDKDGGNGGQGGAKDKVLYTATVTYPRMTPLHNFVNVSRDVTISASSALTNQPYTDQGAYGTPTDRKCA